MTKLDNIIEKVFPFFEGLSLVLSQIIIWGASMSYLHRFYWRHGLFWTQEHLGFFVFVVPFTVLASSSHFRTWKVDPGYVLPS